MRYSWGAAFGALLILVAGCGGPEPDPELVESLEGTGLDLYDVALGGAELVDIAVDDGAVHLKYEEDGNYRYGLTLEPASAASDDPCPALEEEGWHCDSGDGWFSATFEEMSDAGVIRGDTYLLIGGLVTETEAGLLDYAVEALQDAEPIEAEELAKQVAE